MPKAYSPEFKAEVLNRYADGEASDVIGADLGISGTTVLRWVRLAGLEVRPRGIPEAPDAEPIAYEGRWVLRGLVWRPEVAS